MNGPARTVDPGVIPFPESKEVSEIKLLTICTDGRAEVGRVREDNSRREKIREEKEPEERRCRCATRVAKSQSILCFPMICGSGRSKSRLAKAAGAERSKVAAVVKM